MRSLFSVLLAFFVINMPLAKASAEVSDADLQAAANEPAWHALLHYHSQLLGVKSEVNDDWFFLAKNGRTDALAELQADLQALQSDQLNDEHFACKFPARTAWLKIRLQLNAAALPQPKCEAFENYNRAMNASGVTLVYPVAYFNDPQSMFGHTFLLFNQPNETEEIKAKSYTLNYAGKVGENDSVVTLVADGLFGGYKGVFNILPYESKIQEYRDAESRGLWEYKLNLSQAETDQLVKHSWEIYKTHFDYYFLKTNCSFRLLGMLDVARPGMGLENKLNVYAIPVDTVRAVVEQGLVTQTQYQPAGLDYIQNDWAHLSGDSQQFVLNWLALDAAGKQGTTQSELVSAYHHIPANEQVYIQDLTSRYGLLKSTMEKKKVEVAELPALSEQQKTLKMDSPAVPQRDDKGHESVLLSLAAGKYGENARFQEFTWRPAFHSLTDPSYGFVQGMQIKVLETKFRHWQYDVPEQAGALESQDETQVERVDVFDIAALFPRNALFKPTSWQFGLGAYRREVRGVDGRPMLGFMQYRLGRSYEVASVLFYGLMGARMDGGRSLDRGFELGPNAELGAVKQFGLSQWALALEQTAWQVSEEKDDSKAARFTNTWNVGRNGALELGVERKMELEQWFSVGRVGVNYYF